MLTEICAYLKNYFLPNRDDDIHAGDFVISNGSMEQLDYLQEGQYFRIVGSAFNDGVWQYPAYQLQDEAFTGAVWAMRVPPSLIALAAEIEQWQADNAKVLASPFQSESFGGYAYSKASGGRGDGSYAALTWKDQFATRLNPYRRLFVL